MAAVSALQATGNQNAVPKEDRLQLAVALFRDPTNTSSVRELARKHGVARSTLAGRIQEKTSMKEEAQKRQRLNNDEQERLEACSLQLCEWGWPARVEFPQALAVELLKAKGDSQPLGTNWIHKLLLRRPLLNSVFGPSPEHKKPNLKGQELIRFWFQCFARTQSDYNVEPQDTYNMAERGFTVGSVNELKAFHSRQKKAQGTLLIAGDWASVIECVSVDGRFLPSWITFKGKNPQRNLHNALTDIAHLTSTESGWTNSKQFLEWIKQCFDPCTKLALRGQYRLLCLDGQASYVSVDIVEYCLTHKIILLRVPVSSTCALEPLEVGIYPAMSEAYHEELQRQSPLRVIYDIEKHEFLRIYQEIKRAVVTITLICNAWNTVGLAPFNPHRVLQQPPAPSEQQEPQDERWVIALRPLVGTNSDPGMFEGLLVYDGPNGHKERRLDHESAMALKDVLAEASRPGKARKVSGWQDVSSTG